MSNNSRIAFLIACSIVIVAAIPISGLFLYHFGILGTVCIAGIFLTGGAIAKIFEPQPANRVRWTSKRILLIIAAGVSDLLVACFPRYALDLLVASATLLFWASQS